MAVAFVLYNYNGHGRGPRPRTYKGQSVSGEPENQSNLALFLGFYRHQRLTPINLFALACFKTPLKPMKNKHLLRFSTVILAA